MLLIFEFKYLSSNALRQDPSCQGNTSENPPMNYSSKKEEKKILFLELL